MSPLRKTDQRFLLPDTINPNRICLEIDVPNDANHQRAFFAALLELAKAWSWEWDGNKTGLAVAGVWEEIIREATDRFYFDGGGCDMLSLRATPNNSCSIDVSYDDGDTWELLIDFAVCLHRGSTTNIEITNETVNTIITYINDEYDGDPDSINPALEYDGSVNDNDRQVALCWALRNTVDVFLDVYIEGRNNGHSFYGGLAAATAAVAATLTFFYPPAALVVMALALLGTYFLFIDDFLGSRSDVDLQDEDDREGVACCAYDALNGTTISYATFQAAWSSCGFGGVRGDMADALDGVIDGNLDAYLGFLYLWGQLIDASLLAQLPTCPCAEWSYTITDFTSVPNFVLSFVAGYGDYNGAKIIGDNAGDGGNPVIADVFFLCSATDARYTQFVLVYDAIDLSDVDSRYRAWTVQDGLGEANKFCDVSIPAEGTGVDITCDTDRPGEGFRLRFNTGLLLGDVEWQSLVVRGLGINPFI